MIPATSFLLDGDTALWVVPDADHLPQHWERSCDTCDGDGTVLELRPLANTNYRPCPDCDGTGRHTFDIDCDTDEGPRFDFRVHVLDVLPIIDVPDTGYPHPKPEQFAYTSKAGSLRVVDCSAQTDTYISKPPPDAAPGKWLVRLKVPT